jgi:hypothetical protein
VRDAEFGREKLRLSSLADARGPEEDESHTPAAVVVAGDPPCLGRHGGGRASSGRALEINTKSPLASAELIGWWWQKGGNTVSFGSDAHDPYSVGSRFDLAVDIVEAAGFRPGRDRLDFWRR